MSSTAALHDPRTFTTGVPFERIGQLRSEGRVAWVAEPALPGLPAGPGYHLVLDHALVSAVVRNPASTRLSAAGGTQIRDPVSEADLRYVQRMMRAGNARHPAAGGPAWHAGAGRPRPGLIAQHARVAA